MAEIARKPFRTESPNYTALAKAHNTATAREEKTARAMLRAMEESRYALAMAAQTIAESFPADHELTRAAAEFLAARDEQDAASAARFAWIEDHKDEYR